MPVLGIGGLFFRARDPDFLNAWYQEHLGIGAGCNASGAGEPSQWYWMAEGGLSFSHPSQPIPIILQPTEPS